jgi:cell division septum initiation protein DivIVA
VTDDRWQDARQGDDPYGRSREGRDGRIEALRDGALGNRPTDDHGHVVGRRGDPNAKYVRDPGGDVAFDDRWADAHATKLELIGQAEQLAASTDWKAGVARQRDLMTAWKAAGFAGPVTDQELWQRFDAARDRFFSALGQSQDRARQAKEAIVREAQSIASNASALWNHRSIDWKTDSARLHDLMERWRVAGFAGQDHEQRLWEQFQAARKTFRDAGNRHFEDRDRKVRANAAAKERLVADAQRLGTSSDFKRAKEEWHGLMARWKEVGRAGESEQALWDRFIAAKNALWDAAGAEWRSNQNDYIRRVENRIRDHQDKMARLEALRSDLMNRRHNVQPGRRELELVEHYTTRINELDGFIGERKRWLDEDVRKLIDAKSRL